MSKGIVTEYPEICIFCGRQAEAEHHLIFGTAGRELSEKDGFKVVENVEAMRLQIIFDGKPEADVRAVLKKHGFKWAPSQGAWQRMLNPAGKYALNRVKEELEVMQNDN